MAEDTVRRAMVELATKLDTMAQELRKKPEERLVGVEPAVALEKAHLAAQAVSRLAPKDEAYVIETLIPFLVGKTLAQDVEKGASLEDALADWEKSVRPITDLTQKLSADHAANRTMSYGNGFTPEALTAARFDPINRVYSWPQ